ncbi:MAG: hypothetical protein K2Y56_24890 [Methylobacterium sp.]|nr:hypothetical protein [Methylobacterium sp.]
MIISDDALEILADHCMAARAVIEEAGTTSMRHLIDLLLYEVALALAKGIPSEQAGDYREG